MNLSLRSIPMVFALGILAACIDTSPAQAADSPPNILWITSEDNGPYLGCYGDPIARTPHLDRLAQSSTRYLHCISNAAVCAPARQTIISGVYATSLGGEHMRSNAPFPDPIVFFPQFLREAGYFTTNNNKTDYNGGPSNRANAMKAAWSESGNKAHWRNRASHQPFFSVFNIGDTHESRLFPKAWKERQLKTDPQSVALPAYLPDLPEIRLDLARYYDCLERMDQKAGQILQALEDDGLAENTIVFYYSDHGGSMPRGKSFIYESGTKVPLLVRVPDRWKQFRPSTPGSASERLVSFVDFAPTILRLAEVDIPDYMQGLPFLGSNSNVHREFAHTFRGRRGERYDIVRGVRSSQFLYLRNYTPHLPVMQVNDYSFEIPSYKTWMNAWKEGQCNAIQSQWFLPKASEELYDLGSDPHNTTNLAGDPKYAETLHRMRQANETHMLHIRDSAFYPEGMAQRNHSSFQSESLYPLRRLIPLGAKVSEGAPSSLKDFQAAMQDSNPCVRYWGVMGCVVLGELATPANPFLLSRLKDPEDLIQIEAARALTKTGHVTATIPVLHQHLTHSKPLLQLKAALVIDECHLLAEAPELLPTIKSVRGQYGERVSQRLLKTVD